uniref:uncharacterized protein LOC109970735 n=1 Tax=Monopterus albus TaxID=43700 RepID=UPI0009B3E79D|nr:uncharacterized protein LOC109970735 [Monopterus albus]
MSGSAGATPRTGSGLGISGPWPQRALVQTYLLPSSVRPPLAAGGHRGTKTALRLPFLVATTKGPHRMDSMVQLSLSEHSLLTPNEYVLFSGNHLHSVSQRRPPPPPFSRSSALLPYKTSHQSGTSQFHQQQNQQQVQSCSRPAYVNFSQAIQPSSKPIHHSHNTHNLAHSAEKRDLRPLAKQYHNALSWGEPLTVTGKPCLLNSSQRRTLAAGPVRTQLHVFLPTEAEGEETDSESVDEGFMDELDSKITSLKLQ